MADPASILALVSASLTITMRAASVGKSLYTLSSNYQNADKKVQQLSLHVSAIRVAARSLSSWLEAEAVGSEEVAEVKDELLHVLRACYELLSDLEDYVSRAITGAESLNFKGKVSFLWNRGVIQETTQTLHQQETAILLILQTLQIAQKSEQRAKLREHQNLQLLTKAKRPASSIFGLKDDESRSVKYSVFSEHSEKLDVIFSFDVEIMASTAYRNCFTSMIRNRMQQARGLNFKSGSDTEASSVIAVLEADEGRNDDADVSSVIAVLETDEGRNEFQHTQTYDKNILRAGNATPKGSPGGDLAGNRKRVSDADLRVLRKDYDGRRKTPPVSYSQSLVTHSLGKGGRGVLGKWILCESKPIIDPHGTGVYGVTQGPSLMRADIHPNFEGDYVKPGTTVVAVHRAVIDTINQLMMEKDEILKKYGVDDRSERLDNPTFWTEIKTPDGKIYWYHVIFGVLTDNRPPCLCRS